MTNRLDYIPRRRQPSHQLWVLLVVLLGVLWLTALAGDPEGFGEVARHVRQDGLWGVFSDYSRWQGRRDH